MHQSALAYILLWASKQTPSTSASLVVVMTLYVPISSQQKTLVNSLFLQTFMCVFRLKISVAQSINNSFFIFLFIFVSDGDKANACVDSCFGTCEHSCVKKELSTQGKQFITYVHSHAVVLSNENKVLIN